MLLQGGFGLREGVRRGDAEVPQGVEDELQPGTEISVAAAEGGAGPLILDIGILEVNTS